MGKQKHGKPDRFQRDGFAVDESPADDVAVRAAVERFADLFVIKTKRERIAGALVHRKAERRLEAIQHVWEWIDPDLATELEGNTGFPQHLHARFGDLRGIVLDGYRSRHVTVVGAVQLMAGAFGGIFIADGIAMALLLPEIGCPTLCLRR